MIPDLLKPPVILNSPVKLLVNGSEEIARVVAYSGGENPIIWVKTNEGKIIKLDVNK